MFKAKVLNRFWAVVSDTAEVNLYLYFEGDYVYQTSYNGRASIIPWITYRKKFSFKNSLLFFDGSTGGSRVEFISSDFLYIHKAKLIRITIDDYVEKARLSFDRFYKRVH